MDQRGSRFSKFGLPYCGANIMYKIEYDRYTKIRKTMNSA